MADMVGANLNAISNVKGIDIGNGERAIAVVPVGLSVADDRVYHLRG